MLSHIGEMVGRHGFAPRSIRVRAGASLSKFVTGSLRLLPCRERRLAECRGLAPLARRHALVSTEARSACPVDIPNWPAEPKLDRAKVDPRGRTRTCTLEGLSFVPLHWATRGWCPRSDSHRYCARFKCAVSALDYVGKLVPREGFPPPTSPF